MLRGAGSKWLVILGLAGALASPASLAGPVTFTATVDRKQVSQDESVSLKLSIEQDGSASAISDPRYTAPDFDQLTSYQSQSVQSYYENGKFGMRTTLQVTAVLRPKRIGTLKIDGIAVRVGSEDYKAPGLVVQVSAPGAGTAPPKGYGGGFGLQGGGKRGERRPFFLRVEVNKDKVYKGEQLIVSYYLYRRVRVLNIQPTQYPVLSGFLREDLEIPVISQRFSIEPVVLDGTAYDRMLLARYAAYPLQEGRLKLDSMTVQANYYSEQAMPGMDDDDDPFQQFFRRLAPRSDTQKSEQVSVEVLPLPEAGRPAGFTGAVGEFDLKAAVNQTEVKAGEPVTLTVIAEGRGNLSSLKEPKAAWPAGVDLYESKARAKGSSGGIGQKVFEFLVIPRNPGEVILPSLEFSFFNPAKRAYEVKRTDPVRIQVLPGAGGVAALPPRGANDESRAAGAAATAKPAPSIPGLLPLGSIPAAKPSVSISWLLWALGLLAAGAVFGVTSWRDRTRRRTGGMSTAATFAKRWEALAKSGFAASQSRQWTEVSSAYQDLEGILLDEVERVFGLPARSLSRLELERMLRTRGGWNPSWWERCRDQLEFSETARFSGTDRAFQEKAAQELSSRIDQSRELAAELRNPKL